MDETLNRAETRDPAAAPEGRIVRRTLHDEVVSRVRDMIIEGVLAPGTRIHEGQVCGRLGVSRTPLREALKALASEGLVDLVPSRGAVVHHFSSKDVEDMLTVLGTLEALAGRLACANATAAQIGEMRRLHDEMMRLYGRRDRLDYFKTNQSIHSAFIRLSGNAALAYLHDLLQSRLKRIRFIGHEGPEKWAAAVAEHEAMIEALEARDGERLAAVLTRHMTEAWRRVRDVI
jgi:DNA-binding GntR family transcriptional regulator